MDKKDLLSMVYRGTNMGSTATAEVFLRGIEQSPYADKWRQDGLIYSVYANRLSAVCRDSEDPLQKYWKLRKNIMLYDIPERPIEISGKDTVYFLEKIFTRKISDLKILRARYAIICAPNGGLVMDGILIRLEEDRFWYVEANGDSSKWFLALSEGYDVSIIDPESRVLQVQGPNSLKFLRAAAPGQVPDKFGYFHAGIFNLNGQDVLISRTGWTGELGVEIYGHKNLDHSALWDYLFEIGCEFGLESSGSSSLGLRRIEAGILDYRSDMDLTTTPFDVGLGHLVDFSKTDFVGRKSLSQARKEQRLFGYISDDAHVNAGLKIYDGDFCAGITKSSCWSPTLERGIGYVLLNNPMHEVVNNDSRKFSFNNTSGKLCTCSIVDFPFFDKNKELARIEPH